MRGLLQLRWPVAILAVIATTGISAELRAQAPKLTQSERPPFSVTISSKEPVVKSGSIIWVDATVKNTSDEVISVGSTAPVEFAYDIDVWTDKSARAPETKLGRRRNNRTTPEDETMVILSDSAESPLKPGKTLTDHVNVSKMYDLSQPGKYTIEFRRLDEETKTFVKSNKITLTVTP